MNVDDLELSVRTANVLAREGITNMDAFMGLKRPEVMGWTHAGRKTWNEIHDTQGSMRGGNWGESHLLQCVGMVNNAMAGLYGEGTTVRLRVDDDGFLRVYKELRP